MIIRYAIKTWGSGGRALDGCEWLASRPGALPQVKDPRTTPWIEGWVTPRIGFEGWVYSSIDFEG
jgi:hypothetical protein